MALVRLLNSAKAIAMFTSVLPISDLTGLDICKRVKINFIFDAFQSARCDVGVSQERQLTPGNCINNEK